MRGRDSFFINKTLLPPIEGAEGQKNSPILGGELREQIHSFLGAH